MPPLFPRYITDPPTLPPVPGACDVCSAACLSIAGFAVVDAELPIDPIDASNDYLFFLEEGATYSLANIESTFTSQNFAVVCVTFPLPFETVPFAVGSVGMRDNIYGTHQSTANYVPSLDYNHEGAPPYTLADDTHGIYNPTDFRLGRDWSIACQAFCELDLLGEAGQAATINFRMIP